MGVAFCNVVSENAMLGCPIWLLVQGHTCMGRDVGMPVALVMDVIENM